MTSFYTDEELHTLGLKAVGNNVRISRKASIYSPSTISIGDNVRIDDFCILSGRITIGSHIHISAYVALYGALGIEIRDYSRISPRTTLYSAMDDFSGDYLVGPIHDEGKTNVQGGKIVVGKYVQIGCNCVVFPNLTIDEGAVVGAMSLVRSHINAWTVNVGIPTREIKQRKQGLLNLVPHL